MSLLTYPRRGAGPQWVTAIGPTRDDLQALGRMGFRQEDLLHMLDPHERCRIRTTGDATLVVLRVASVDGESTAPLTTVPFGLLLGPELGLVISANDHQLVRQLTAFFEREETLDGAAAHRVKLPDAGPLVIE